MVKCHKCLPSCPAFIICPFFLCSLIGQTSFIISLTLFASLELNFVQRPDVASVVVTCLLSAAAAATLSAITLTLSTQRYEPATASYALPLLLH